MELKRELKNLPMIIAVKGNPIEAVELAKHLRYSFINHQDIASNLQQSLPSSSGAATPQLDDLCFNIVCQVASTQLKMEIRVVISVPLHKRIHFNQLEKLAQSADASLMVVQCQTQDERDDLDVRGVVKLAVDTSTPFNVEKLVKMMLDARELLKLKCHFHALKLYTDGKDEQNRNLHCKRCSEDISGPSYQCVECDKHNFHKSCAELASSLDGLRENCPTYLKGNKPNYKYFSKQHRCESCEVSNSDFSEDCHHCLFQTNMKLGHLPIVLQHKSHAHPLSLIIMPHAQNYKYACCGCGELGECISYRCVDCNFNLHISCVLLPHVLKSIRHIHLLALYYGLGEDDLDYEDSQCNVCNNGRNLENWVYVCEECKWVAHIACAI
ncbi:hypothetical protein SLEP1_g25669 [Rubroshorea leprosula]|uniref:DC1 domain-containing protein n=1 Tax=Rubroshorea leprosula TaxID=152421 RepID=A0AAV5JMS3_9ROSI|nr:hypothetical protein SLEP1_g25669 [Rubroshorea leprosula]